MPAPTSAPFFLLSAFSSSAHAGNPAAVILLPRAAPLDDAKMQAIARDLVQPMHAFVSPPRADDTAGHYGIRWFTRAAEQSLCGHATLAAAKAMWSAGPTGQYAAAADADVLRFRTAQGVVVSARRRGPRIEITFPHAPTTPIPHGSPEGVKIRGVLAKALRGEGEEGGEDIEVRYMGHGTGSYKEYLLVELGESRGFRLEGRAVDTDALRNTGYPINILSSAGDGKREEQFVSRMFAPECGVPEDQVCGSAHCVLTPYWAQKRDPAIATSTEMVARQVSERGGLLAVSWDSEAGLVTIGGEVVVWARGEIDI